METAKDLAPPIITRHLRPMSVGELLDQSLFFYRTHFWTLVAFISLFTVPLVLVTTVTSAAPSLMAMNPTLVEENVALFGGAYILSMLGSLVVSLLSYLLLPLEAAGVGIALHGYFLEGRQVSMREMMSGIRQNFGPLLATTILGGIVSVGVVLTFIIPPVGLAINTLFSFAFYLALFVVLYEKKQGVEALRRGWLLVRGSIWRAMQYLILYLLFTTAFTSIIVGLFTFGAVASTAFLENVVLLLVAQAVGATVATVLSTPVLFAVLGLLYFDLRMRHEGLDISVAVAQAAGEPVNLSQTPASTAPIMNNETWRSIGILSAAYTGIVVLFCGLIFLLIFGLPSLIGG